MLNRFSVIRGVQKLDRHSYSSISGKSYTYKYAEHRNFFEIMITPYFLCMKVGVVRVALKILLEDY